MDDFHVDIEPSIFGLRLYIKELKEITNTSILFDGYFRAEAKLLPIRSLLYIYDKKLETFVVHLVTFDSKELLEDTSKTFYDEDFGGHRCLTPTELIRLTYTILYTFKNDDEADIQYYKKLLTEIEKENEARLKENEALRHERERQENEEAMRSYVAPKL
jgi:hypothetical protein